MTVVNKATSGDHVGEIKYKNMKKGLYIEETKLFLTKQIFINKETVDGYEVLKDDSESQSKGSLAKGLLGASVFGITGAIVGGGSRKTTTQHRYLVSVKFKDGTKSLCELDDKFYEILIKLLY